MAHTIVDDESNFYIDTYTREITTSDEDIVLIQNDHNSEKFTFEMQDDIEGHSPGDCNVVRVHYINTANDGAFNSGLYDVTDLSIDSSNVTSFSWLISQEATKYVGALAFSVEFMCVEPDGFITFAWHTGIFSNVKVATTVDTTDEIATKYADILTHWYNDLYATTEMPIELLTQEEFAALGENVEENTLYLLKDDDTLPSIEKRLEELEYDADTNAENLSTLRTNTQDALDSMQNSIKNANEHIDTINTRVVSLEDRAGGIEGNVVNLISRVDELGSLNVEELNGLPSDVAYLKNNVADFKTIDYSSEFMELTSATKLNKGLWLLRVCSYLNTDNSELSRVSVVFDTDTKTSSVFRLGMSGLLKDEAFAHIRGTRDEHGYSTLAIHYSYPDDLINEYSSSLSNDTRRVVTTKIFVTSLFRASN